MSAGYVPHHAPLIEYPFQIRPGVWVRLVFPEDFNTRDAQRVTRFVEGLAVADDDMEGGK